jgi:hypothetical protein
MAVLGSAESKHGRFSLFIKAAYAVPMKKYWLKIMIQSLPDVSATVLSRCLFTEEALKRSRERENKGRCLVGTDQNMFRSSHNGLRARRIG